MSRARAAGRLCLALCVSVAVMGALPAGAEDGEAAKRAAPPQPEPADAVVLPEGDEGVAVRFAQLFLGGLHDEGRPLLAPQMEAVFSSERAEGVRQQLLRANGPPAGLGRAWLEGSNNGLSGWRVPAVFAQAIVDFRVVIDSEGRVAGFRILPHERAPKGENDEPPVRQEQVAVGQGDDALPGVLTLPDGEGPFAAVLLVHGSGPLDRDATVGPNKPFRDLAHGLSARGVAALRYDKRTLVRPESILALGDALTVREEVLLDAAEGLALLRGHPQVDASRIFVLGHSLGGALAPRIAGLGPLPAGLVLLAPSAFPLYEKVLEQGRQIVALDGEVTAEEQQQLATMEEQVAQLRSALAGEAPDPSGPVLGAPVGYYRDLEAHDAPQDAAALGLPVLLLQGGRDDQVGDADFARWREALASAPDTCLHRYPTLDHLFRPGEGPAGPESYARAAPLDPRVVDAVAEFVNRGVCPESDPVEDDAAN